MELQVDKVVLSFHDSLLRVSDVNLLTAGRWLNDKIVSFTFEYFEVEKYSKYAQSVAFIGPEVTQLIKLSQDEELGVFLDPLNLQDKQWIFLAVNDHASSEHAGGSHWSLLMCDRASGVFEHRDSMGGANHKAAERIALRVAHYLQVQDFRGVTETPCPQQTNSSDCGVYLICFTDQLCKQRFEESNLTLDETTTPDAVAKQRIQLGELIAGLSMRDQAT